MKPMKFVATAAFAFATAMAGVAQADLATDLTTMSAADALAKAVESGDSVEALITDAAAQLKDNPALLSALISEAVKAFPEQAAQIVQAAVSQAPQQKAAITTAAVAELDGNEAAQTAVQQAADEAAAPVVADTQNTQVTETEAEQTEVQAPQQVAPTPPPPPPAIPSTPDRPPVVSPN